MKVIKSLSDYSNSINEKSEIYFMTIISRNSCYALNIYYYYFPSPYHSIRRSDDLIEVCFLYVLKRKDLSEESESIKAKDT